MVNGRIINPYLNVAAKDDPIGNSRIVQFSATSAPLIVNNWVIPNGTSQNVELVSRPASWRQCGPMCRSPPVYLQNFGSSAAKIFMAPVSSRFGSSA